MLNFKKIAAALEAHPNVWLIRAHFWPGATDEQIATAEANLEAPLHPDLIEFYKRHNGLFVKWLSKDSPLFASGNYEEISKTDLRILEEEELLWYDLMRPDGLPTKWDGQMVFASVQEVFGKEYTYAPGGTDLDPAMAWFEYIKDSPIDSAELSRAKPFVIAGRTFASELDFRAQLRLFENHSEDRGKLMLWEPGKSDPEVFHCETHWCSFDLKFSMPMTEFIRGAAYNFGTHHWCEPFYGVERAPRSFDPTQRLEEVLAEL